jgi:prolyl-tRNA synthetase
MLGVYRTFAEESLAIPVLSGRKTDSEKFAGALRTYCIEGMMQDRKALQAGTSHNLGQNFARAFGVQFQDAEGRMQHAWNTSWGVSTRLVGAVVMAHGDDKGLVLPPRIAPTQAVIVPIYSSDEERAKVAEFTAGVEAALRGRATFETDWRDQYKPGWKYADWEQKGVPLRVEVGPKDVAKGQVMLARRDGGPKQPAPVGAVAEVVPALLGEIQASLYKKALEFRDAHTFDVDDGARFDEILNSEGGFVRALWCGSAECEAAVKERTKATIRVVPTDGPAESGRCAACAAPAEGVRVVWARAY